MWPELSSLHPSSVPELKEHFASVVVPVAARFNLSVNAFGKNVSAGNGKGGHVVLSDAFGTGLEPSPVTPMGTDDPYQILAGTIKATIASAKGYNASGVVVALLLQLGNTGEQSMIYQCRSPANSLSFRYPVLLEFDSEHSAVQAPPRRR